MSNLSDDLNELIKNNPGRERITTIPHSFEEHCKTYFFSVENKYEQTIFREIFFDFSKTIIIWVVSLGVLVSMITSPSIFERLQDITSIEPIYWVLAFLLLFIMLVMNGGILLSIIEKVVFKGSLSEASIKFCHLQIVINNLVLYLTNDMPSHLNKASKHLEKYFRSRRF